MDSSKTRALEVINVHTNDKQEVTQYVLKINIKVLTIILSCATWERFLTFFNRFFCIFHSAATVSINTLKFLNNPCLMYVFNKKVLLIIFKLYPCTLHTRETVLKCFFVLVRSVTECCVLFLDILFLKSDAFCKSPLSKISVIIFLLH